MVLHWDEYIGWVYWMEWEVCCNENRKALSQLNADLWAKRSKGQPGNGKMESEMWNINLFYLLLGSIPPTNSSENDNESKKKAQI